MINILKQYFKLLLACCLALTSGCSESEAERGYYSVNISAHKKMVCRRDNTVVGVDASLSKQRRETTQCFIVEISEPFYINSIKDK